jgi:4-oxalocrotonate tautomerase
MPYINLKTNLVNIEEKKEELLDLILSSTKNILRKDEKVTSVLIENILSEWFINKEDSVTFFLEIKITKDTNTKEEKKEYIKRIFQGIEKLEQNINKASYVIITEVEADSWGYDGITQEQRYKKN